MNGEALIPPDKDEGFGLYLSDEDSTLLRRAIRGYSGETSLEIGAGNGGNLVELADKFETVVGTDLMRPASKISGERANANFVLADGASCFRESAFDLVAFNPPYVPTEAIEDLAVDGGKDGVEVALKFLRDALEVMKNSGRVVMLVSSDNPLKALEKECRRRGFSLAPLTSKRLFYEILFVYVAERHPSQA